jgi:hypothetical protein
MVDSFDSNQSSFDNGGLKYGILSSLLTSITYKFRLLKYVGIIYWSYFGIRIIALDGLNCGKTSGSSANNQILYLPSIHGIYVTDFDAFAGISFYKFVLFTISDTLVMLPNISGLSETF